MLEVRSFFLKYRLLLSRLSQKNQYFLVGVLFFICFLSYWIFFWSAPRPFPHYSTIHIEEGIGLSETAHILRERGVVRSEFWFKIVTVILHGSRSIHAGDYYFNDRENLFTIARRLSQGEYGLVPLRITIPEGLSVFQIAPILKEKLSLFDEQEFIEKAPEGYLFPDTYFFLPNAHAETIISRMQKNFDEKTEDLKNEIGSTTLSFKEIVILASILEEEAIYEKDKKKIAGVLMNRLKIDMPLQVDATFSYYVNGKGTYSLSRDDLKDDSPYNTYTNKGLPPGPIANPGLVAIRAALYPEATDALYFLSDLSGTIYYAKDFEGHQRNRELYLRK